MAPTLLIVLFAAAISLALNATTSASGSWSPDPAVIDRLNANPRVAAQYDEASVPDYDLPDVLATRDGQPITTAEQWQAHRDTLLDLFREQMFGRPPGAPDELTFELRQRDEHALGGSATYHRIDAISRVGERSHRFEFVLFTPNDAAGPVPAFVLIDHRWREDRDRSQPEDRGYWSPQLVIERGYAVAAIRANDLAPDHADHYTEGIIELFEGYHAPTASPAPHKAGTGGAGSSAAPAIRRPDAVMALAAWGWGASRVMDYFEQSDAIDASRVAVLGHSRNGKAALWTGAEDQRFDVVISNNSGCGGAALSRRAYGETVRIINEHFPHWFTAHFKAYADREQELPFDQHQLIALTAPRAVYVASAGDDLWADPRGEYLALAHASPVWALWGHDTLDPDAMPGLEQPVTTGLMGYHLRTGGHGLTPYDWNQYLDFATRRWQ
ncbi:MAG: hypothetical protein WD009_07610 [Phycisphaeraceae bacterium]